MKLFNQTGEGFGIMGKCLYSNYIPPKVEGGVGQYKVGLTGNFGFFINEDMPGADCFERNWIVTVHASAKETNVKDGKEYTNLKGNIRIMDLKEPIVNKDNPFKKFAPLPKKVARKKKSDTALDSEELDI